MNTLALPDPQTLAAAQAPALVKRVRELREHLRETRDAAGAEDLRRRLAAYERYISDKNARVLLEAESRRTESLIGWLSLEDSKLWKTVGSGLLDLFRRLDKHDAVVEELLAGGTTKRDPILKEIARRDAAARGRPVQVGGPVRDGDWREQLADVPDESVSLIFTDPPYAREHVGDYAELAAFAARVLRPGGSLVAYCGQYALPELLATMGDHLRFWWLLACHHQSGHHRSLSGKRVYVLWKPLVWYVKDTYTGGFVHDLVSHPPPDKSLHDWSQSLLDAEAWIGELTAGDELVIDPYCGAGTTLLAARSLGRRYLGVERDPDHAARARARLAEAKAA